MWVDQDEVVKALVWVIWFNWDLSSSFLSYLYSGPGYQRLDNNKSDEVSNKNGLWHTGFLFLLWHCFNTLGGVGTYYYLSQVTGDPVADADLSHYYWEIVIALILSHTALQKFAYPLTRAYFIMNASNVKKQRPNIQMLFWTFSAWALAVVVLVFFGWGPNADWTAFGLFIPYVVWITITTLWFWFQHPEHFDITTICNFAEAT